MESRLFDDLLTFNEQNLPSVALHYANLVRCVKLDMMYDFNMTTVVPRRVFDEMLASNKIDEFAANPSHPVFGDMQEYLKDLGPKIVSFSSNLDILCSGLKKTLETDPQLLREFSQILTLIEPELLQALRFNQIMSNIMSKREVWIEIMRFSAESRGEKASIPTFLNIDRLYMDIALDLSDEDYHEEISAMTSDSMMDGMVVQIANEQEFGRPRRVILQRGTSEITYQVTQNEHGYNATRIVV